MPRFFFDVDNGRDLVRDDVGMCLHGLDEVARETRDLLEIIGTSEILKGRDQLFTAIVRDANGHLIYRGSMRLQIERRHDLF